MRKEALVSGIQDNAVPIRSSRENLVVAQVDCRARRRETFDALGELLLPAQDLLLIAEDVPVVQAADPLEEEFGVALESSSPSLAFRRPLTVHSA
jgi:hypothetical protein